MGTSANQQAEACAQHSESLLSFYIFFFFSISFPSCLLSMYCWFRFTAAINHLTNMLMDEPAQGVQV